MHAAAVTAATVTAATAASIAQAASASAGAGAADKHSRGSGPDSSTSGSSNDGTAGAAQLLSSAASISSTDPSPVPTLKVPAGVDTAEFGQGVADRVSLMMDSNLTSAKLQVNPPALGPIEVRIALQSGHAQVWFTSHSADTRDALESTAPKLREMLGAQGFGQVSVDISQRSFQERSPPPKGYEATPAIGSESSASAQTPSAHSRTASGLLDAYA
jgi:flagellar hook-length control protein FliK